MNKKIMVLMLLMCCGLSMHAAQLQQQEEQGNNSSSFLRDFLEVSASTWKKVALIQTAFIVGARNGIRPVMWAIRRQQALFSSIEKQKYLSFLELKADEYSVGAYMTGNLDCVVIPVLFGMGCHLAVKYLDSKNKVQKDGLEKLQGKQDEVSKQNNALAAEASQNE